MICISFDRLSRLTEVVAAVPRLRSEWRLPSGWWIVPGVVLGLVIWWQIIRGMLWLLGF